MQNRRSLLRCILSACAMLVLIFDAKTAVSSAREGVSLCFQTIIPSLFPFLALTSIVNCALLGQNPRLLRPLGRLCKIPEGGESLLLLGCLAGYPVGALQIAQAYRAEKLSKVTARRMLGFCNNAGPAFIFGILSPIFSNIHTVWLIWGIHILSALFTACIIPAEKTKPVLICTTVRISFTDALQAALKATANICGWVILFRVIIGFCNRWFLWWLTPPVQVLVSGALELSNGCLLLKNIQSEAARFLLAGVMLSFGGLCVGMQTASVTAELGIGWYFPGKALQTAFAALLSLILQPFLFGKDEALVISMSAYICIVSILLLLIVLLRHKKVVAFPKGILYNRSKQVSKGARYAVSKENFCSLRLLSKGHRNG